jgi:hypothetical protein
VDRRFIKRLLILMFCYSFVLVLFVGAYMHGVLSLYGLIDIAIPLSAVGMFFVLLRFSQKAKEARAAGLSSANVPFSPSRQRAILEGMQHGHSDDVPDPGPHRGISGYKNLSDT